MEALHDVVKAGKARYIGGSNMHVWQFAKAIYTSRQQGWTEVVTDDGIKMLEAHVPHHLTKF